MLRVAGLRAGGALLFLSMPAAPAMSARVDVTKLDWRRVATDADRQRIRGWRDALLKGVAAAEAGGYGGELAGEGALFKPEAALDGAAIPPGNYRCRVIKLGAKGSATLTYTSYPAYTCRVDGAGNGAQLRKITGSQRPTGVIFTDGDAPREIFLGTMMLSDERRPVSYGLDPDRDMAGIIERIGDKRWRMLLPYPRFESIVDVVEFVPQP